MKAFTAWCRALASDPLPAAPETVSWHISAIACDGLSVSSIGRRLAAIAYAHKLAKLPPPCQAEEYALSWLASAAPSAQPPPTESSR